MKNYLLAFCTDFFDDIRARPFDREYLKKMFSIMRDIGMRRVYWIYTLRFKEGIFDCLQTKEHSENAGQTYKNMGDFLPAAVETAHELGLECYAVYKPFDLAFSLMNFPYGTQEAKRFGKLDSLGGRIAWAAESLVAHKDKRLERHPADFRNSGATVFEIRITTSKETPGIHPELLKLLVSDDNIEAKPYQGEPIFHESFSQEGRTLSIKNLNIKDKFIILKYNDSARGESIANTLEKLIRIYDKRGGEIPFTYSLCSGGGHWFEYDGSGIFFDYENAAANDNFLGQKSYSLDNKRGYIIIARGKEKYIAGALSPAYEESHEVWLKHISECLDAGVDGVDLRVANHNRSLEFERYGFETPVTKEYKKRYGIDIINSDCNPELHRRLLGEFYTSFCRKASSLIRERGAKVQMHIGSHLVNRNKFERYMNFNWEWEKWLRDNLADAITIKDGGPVDSALWETVKSRFPDNSLIPAFYCPYWKSITPLPNWQKKFRESLEKSYSIGQSGFILYETAMCLGAMKNHKFEFFNPELPQILTEFMKSTGTL
jgi:hypothetical protein